MKETVEIILTSVVVSGLVSSAFLLINDALRRRSEEKMTIFKTAAQLTELRQSQIIELIKRTDKQVLWPAALKTFNKTFKEVNDIWSGKFCNNRVMKKETIECCSERMVVKNCHQGCGGSSGAIYGLGVVGALFYFLQGASTVSAWVIGIGKAVFWPAILMFQLLTYLKI